VSGIEAFPVGNTSLFIEHPEFSHEDFYLDQTPDGDYIMFVPAGLWDVKIYPRGDSLVTNYETLMVPVHSGEMTVVDVPFNISNALKAGSNDYNERGIRIGTFKEDAAKNQVAFSFTLLDKSTKNILPDLRNTTVTEGGAPTKLISVERVKTPPSVALLLDSSGSMKGQMQATLNAAEAFIKGLPDDTKIRIVDFDDTPRELKGSTKDEAVRNLSLIKVGGYTALYEAISMGLDMLRQEDRPTLVVFTDGENEVKYSGGLTLDEILNLVHEAGIPLFTIGFGKDHDSATLESLAKVSDGRYFSADDGEALKNVFAVINERLGNTFEATYERPVEASIGDIPVVSFVIDTSGSMIEDYDEKYGSRIHNVKNLLRQFILGLPDEVQMQLTEFDSEIKIVQALTTDKLKVLRGLGRLEALGGTNITGSVLASYKTLKEIPSTKKVLVYITDAALETTAPDNDFFLELLADIKKDEINVLWVGLGIEDEIEDFRLAAEISGGEYVVTEDLELLSESFNRVLREVQNTPQSGLSNLFIGIEKIAETGARESYSTGKLVELSPVKKSGEIVVAETIKYTPGKILRQYDAYTADYISGYGVPAQDTIITKRMEVDKKGANKAARIIADGIVFMKRLNGVDAPSNYRFMAITMEMKNILEAQEVTVYPDGSSHPSSWLTGGAKGKTQFIKIPYMIPDFASHFSLSYNNEGSYPGSMATWLVEKPLAVPGDNSITIMPDETIPGTLVFLVPDTPMEQSSLHFYDINYGHIDLPLVGEMKKKGFDVKSLPKQEPAKLTDTFTLEITGCEEIAKIPGTGKDATGVETDKGFVPGAGAVFKVVEGNFTSQMQALLNIDPLEQFSLRIKTASGDFYIPVNPATNLLPAGFVNPRMISPGSFNKVRWLFEVPEGLKNSASEIFVDLREEDKTAPVAKGEILPAGLNAKYKSELIDLTVNNLVKISDGINEYFGDYIIADITIHDKKDNFSSTGIAGLFSVVSDAFFEMTEAQSEENSEGESGFYEESGSVGLGNFAQGGSGGGSTLNRLVPYSLTEQIILGYADDIVVYDGTSRRGVIIFQVPNEEKKEWYLYSEAFAGLKMKATSGTYNKGLLAEKVYFETDHTFARNLNTAISLAVEKYRLHHPEKAAQLANGNIPLGEPAVDKQEIPAPTISLYGAQLIKGIDSVDGMIKAMKQLRYIPSTGSYGPFNHSFSKEAMMTQGFGMEQDYANMAVEVLSRLGYHPKLKIVKLTDRGRKELTKMSGVKGIAIDYLPAVSYMDDDSNYHVLVMPFMEELDILKRLVYLDHAHYLEKAPNTIRLEVNVHGYPTEKGVKEHMGDIADALGGDTEGEPKLISQWLYNDLIGLDILSLDAIDVGIAKDGNIARVYLIKADGEIFGEQYIELDKFDVKKIELIFNLPHESNVSHIVRLDEDMEIDDVFITVSINAPDLSKEASIILQETAKRVHSRAEKPSELSALRWYGRSIIAKFISSQTLHDRAMIKDMGLVAGRTTKPRVIVVTHKAGEKLRTSINLLEVHDQIHAGKEDEIKTFNVMSGIYASTLEATVLPDEASGLAEIWMQAPRGTELVFLEYLDQNARSDLEGAGVSRDMINHFENTSNMILITDRPSIIDGYKRWAWFEINPKTYEMISVIDTLEQGAFVESTVVDTVKSAAQYAMGAFKGVEASVWSVAAFSLENDDYHQILKSAKALALGIADNFGFNMGPIGGSVGSKLSISQAVGPVKFSFDGSANASQNILGFTDGYKAGVEYYFESAK
jgi:Mg-chelatase subunit ChlD